MKPSALLLCCLFLFLSGCVALQQDMVYLEERVMAVERKNQDLQNQLQSDMDKLGKNRQSSEQNLRTQVAGMNADMDGLQEEIRLLKGRVEEIEYLINRKVSNYEASDKKNTERIEQASLSLAKIDQRLSQLERYLNVEGKSGQSSPAPVAPAAPAPALP